MRPGSGFIIFKVSCFLNILFNIGADIVFYRLRVNLAIFFHELSHNCFELFKVNVFLVLDEA